MRLCEACHITNSETVNKVLALYVALESSVSQKKFSVFAFRTPKCGLRISLPAVEYFNCECMSLVDSVSGKWVGMQPSPNPYGIFSMMRNHLTSITKMNNTCIYTDCDCSSQILPV